MTSTAEHLGPRGRLRHARGQGRRRCGGHRVRHHRRSSGRRPRRHVGAARRDRGRRHHPQALRHRLAQGLRLLPHVPGRGRRGARRARVVHDAVRDGMVVSTQTETVRDLRRNVMELYLSDHPEDCDGCARGNCEIQALAAHGRLRRGPLRAARDPRRRRPPAAGRPEQPLLRLRRLRLHRLLTLRARLRRHPGHLRADRRGPRLRLEDQRRRHRLPRPRSASRAAPACRPARRPPCRRSRSSRSACRPARSRPPAPTAASAARSAPRSRATATTPSVVRMIPSKNGGANEGHSCVKGRFAYGYAAHKDRQLSPMVRDTIDDEWRTVSWDEAIAKVGRRVQGPPGRARRRRDRRHLVQPLHQRGGLRRPEDGAGGLRQQQHRHLRAGLPLPDGLRAQADLRHLRRHPGLPLGRGRPT